MITREASDRYRIETLGGEINITLSADALIDRLRATGVWPEDRLQGLIDMEVGDQTPPVRAVMVKTNS